MTKQELLRAFEMRVDGLSYEQIGEALHYDAGGISDALYRVVNKTCVYGRTMRRIVYPEIAAYCKANDMNIATLYRATHKGQIRPWRFYKVLYGEAKPNEGDVIALTELLGKPYKEVFRRDDA